MSKRTPPKPEHVAKKQKTKNVLELTSDVAFMLKKSGATLDVLLGQLDKTLLLRLLSSPLLSFEDLTACSTLNWSWVELFNGDLSFWELLMERKLSSLSNAKCGFEYVPRYAQQQFDNTLFPKALSYSLNTGLLSRCTQCNYTVQLRTASGKPVSVFELYQNNYYCVNPKCTRLLEGTFCGYPLRMAFDACNESRGHLMTELNAELGFANQSDDKIYENCIHCGLLVEAADSDSDSDYCGACLEHECICVPCKLCQRMPVKCRCETCDRCEKCTACTRCPAQNRCNCQTCEECDMYASECECSSEYEF
jgi:hypothetical protein